MSSPASGAEPPNPGKPTFFGGYSEIIIIEGPSDPGPSRPHPELVKNWPEDIPRPWLNTSPPEAAADLDHGAN